MPTRLRVLLVEDQPSDAKLLVHELRRTGFAVDWTRVDTESAYLVALDAAPDLVLADYSLPGFDGLRALALLRERAMDVPFILVSGVVGEEVAVAAIKQGATDYLLKDRLARLGTAVAQALEQQRLRAATRAAEEAQRAAEARYRALVQNSLDAICLVEPDGTLRYVSPSVERLLGYRPDDLIGTSSFALVHPDDLPSLRANFAEDLGRSGTGVTVEYRLRHADGTWRWFEAATNNLLADPHMRGLVVNSRDITERKALEERLRHLALRDALTGLPNRTAFLERLDRALVRTKQGGASLAVLFLDLDGFKRINDGLGHDAGDQLLTAVGARLTSCLRKEDTAARIGGDEYAVLVERLIDPNDAVQLAARILDTMRAPFLVRNHELHVATSIGVTIGGSGRVSPMDLLRDADVALYQAKATGRACYVVFEPNMSARVARQAWLETGLWRALERGEFRLHYQPEVDLATGRVVGLEALVRWEHPNNGLVPPSEFVPLAEETGLIVPLGRWVLENACCQAQAWQERYPRTPPLVVSVNLSARQLQQDDIVEQVAHALASSGLTPAQLRLEITERVLVQDVETANRALSALKALGIGLAIDSFGTGYSSLGYLRELTTDVLKIDRSFIAGLDQEEGNLAIVEAIAALAHALGKEVTAEGIETADELIRVRAASCPRGQGFFFARPLPPAEFEALLAQDKPFDVLSNVAALPASSGTRKVANG